MFSNTKRFFIHFHRPLTPQAHPDASYLEGHKLVVRFRRPGVDLHWVLQGNHQEFNPLVLHCRTKQKQVRYVANISHVLKLFKKLLVLETLHLVMEENMEIEAQTSRLHLFSYRLCNARSPPGLQRWSIPVSFPLQGRCVISCSWARTGSKHAACSSSLVLEEKKTRKTVWLIVVEPHF